MIVKDLKAKKKSNAVRKPQRYPVSFCFLYLHSFGCLYFRHFIHNWFWPLSLPPLLPSSSSTNVQCEFHFKTFYPFIQKFERCIYYAANTDTYAGIDLELNVPLILILSSYFLLIQLAETWVIFTHRALLVVAIAVIVKRALSIFFFFCIGAGTCIPARVTTHTQNDLYSLYWTFFFKISILKACY